MNQFETCNDNLDEINAMPMAIFSVCTVYDKAVFEEKKPSKYEVPIQAGAALTDKRICRNNDFDGAIDSISDQNQRYCELTVWKYIWKNIKTPYVGLCHYRRKFDVTDELLEQWMDEDVDFIMSARREDGVTQWDGYRTGHYGYDFDLMLQLLNKYHPEDYEAVVWHLKQDYWYPNCCAICKKEVWDALCEWLFPILEEFCAIRPLKKDVYQRREAGFLAERLISAYFDIKKESMNTRTASLYELKSETVANKEEFDHKNVEQGMEAIRKAVANRNTFAWRRLLADTYELQDKEILQARMVYLVIDAERRYLPECMLDYLEFADDYDKLLEYVNIILVLVHDIIQEQTVEKIQQLVCFVNSKKCTSMAILETMMLHNFMTEKNLYLFAAIFEANGLINYAYVFYQKAVMEFADSVVAKQLLKEFEKRHQK